MKPTVIAYFMSNSTMPNLIVKGPAGTFDLTATFASIERRYGSRTECSEAEAEERRKAKEVLKLECVRYAISGPNEEDEDTRAENWLLPRYPSGHEICYTALTLRSAS